MLIIKKKITLLLFVIFLLIIFIAMKPASNNTDTSSSVKNDTLDEDFTPRALPSGSETVYAIDLKMDQDGIFQTETKVNIKNTSGDVWQELVFYFIPNIFTEKSSNELGNTLDIPATVQINDVSLGNKSSVYKLEKDTLTVPLETEVQPGDDVEVNFSYQFTLPVGGLRFTKSNENFHLAQFYPMLATYRDHKWNKEDYRFRGETYHTGFSDFKVTYDIPESYTFVSTGSNKNELSGGCDAFTVSNVKEIFIAILKDPLVVVKEQDKINIRVFGFEVKPELYREISDIASDSLDYFQKIVGPYPFAKLDIIVDGLGMEYPGIVTAGSIYSQSVNDAAVKSMVVHEIAHQWFYGIINNDPYNEAWLDEGFTSFATELFHYSHSEDEVPYNKMLDHIKEIDNASLPVNLPLDQYKNSSHFYGIASTMLWQLFKDRGGIKEAEKFLKTYYDFYNYKEVNTEEFVRFATYYFNLEEDSELSAWLQI